MCVVCAGVESDSLENDMHIEMSLFSTIYAIRTVYISGHTLMHGWELCIQLDSKSVHASEWLNFEFMSHATIKNQRV